MKRFLLILLAAPAAFGATYNVALPGGGVLTINGVAFTNPAITNSASVVWGVDGAGFLYATATGTNASVVYVEGAAVAGANFGVSTEIDPVVTASTNITFSLVAGSITTNKIDTTFYGLLMAAGSGDVTQAGNNTFTGTNIFQSSTTISNLTVDALSAGSLTLDTPIGVTAVGTNAADARVQLGVAYDVNVQAYHLELLQAALALTANGHMIYHNGTLVTNLLSTTAGRYLLTAATATDQRNSLVVGELSQTAYGAGWNGETGKTATLEELYNKFESLPGGSNNISSWNTDYFSVTAGYLDWVGGSVGGGGAGFTYILTNSLGTWQGRDTSTNWTILSKTISSNDLPTATGKFIEGGWSLVGMNNSGTTATPYLNVLVGGTLVFSDSYTWASAANTYRPMLGDFRLVRESSTKASLVQQGQNATSGSSTPVGIGDFGSSPTAATIVTTNITVDWTSNLAFSVEMYCDTSTSTNTALGIRPVSAWMRRDATASSGTGDVVGPASSTTNNIAVFADATGKLIADGGVTVASLATEAEVAAGYQPLDADLTDLADGSLTGSKVGTGISADNITTGTITSNRLPAAVSFTTIDVGTINASAVVGDAGGLTGINATNITAGELADARLAATIARTNAPTLHSPALLGDPTAPTASANDNDTSIATTAYVQSEETALKAMQLWQGTNAALTALAANPQIYQSTNGNLTTLAGASITGAGNFMRTRTGVPREIWIPASAMNPGSDAPTPATNAWATTTDGQRWEGWDFSATATNSVCFTLALPTAWDAGTVKVKLCWKQVVAAATATNSWQIGGGSLTDGETGGNTLGTLIEVLDVGANDTNVVSVSAASGAITIGGTPSAGHLTWFTVRRHPGDSDDNYAELSRLIGLHLQYTETSTEPSSW